MIVGATLVVVFVLFEASLFVVVGTIVGFHSWFLELLMELHSGSLIFNNGGCWIPMVIFVSAISGVG